MVVSVLGRESPESYSIDDCWLLFVNAVKRQLAKP